MCSPPVIANAAVYNISGKIKRINSHVIANFASMPRYTQELEMIMRSGAQRGAVIFNGGELNVGGDYESIGSTTTVNFGQVRDTGVKEIVLGVAVDPRSVVDGPTVIILLLDLATLITSITAIGWVLRLVHLPILLPAVSRGGIPTRNMRTRRGRDAYNRGILTEEERPEERTDWEKDIGMRHRNALRTTPDILKLAPSDELPGGPTPRKEWQTVEHSESQISNIGQIAM